MDFLFVWDFGCLVTDSHWAFVLIFDAILWLLTLRSSFKLAASRRRHRRFCCFDHATCCTSYATWSWMIINTHKWLTCLKNNQGNSIKDIQDRLWTSQTSNSPLDKATFFPATAWRPSEEINHLWFVQCGDGKDNPGDLIFQLLDTRCISPSELLHRLLPPCRCYPLWFGKRNSPVAPLAAFHCCHRD